MRHPLKASLISRVNTVTKYVSKRYLTNINIKKNKKQFRILGFRFLFIKKTSNYYTLNLLNLPIVRDIKHENKEDNSITTYHYFLGILYAKDIAQNDWRSSSWFSNRKRYNWINNRLDSIDQLSIDKRVSNQHIKIFPQFYRSNIGKTIKIYGKGLIFDDSIDVSDGKVIACNKNLTIYKQDPDYIFASEYIALNYYFYRLITLKDSTVFLIM